MLAKKSLGQHWLNDKASLLAMLDAAEINSDDTILEIGPGLGSLTSELVKKAEKVIAVEKDEALAADLSSKITSDKLAVITGDILRFNFASLPAGYKLVANIPYYLTSNLIRIISETSNPPTRASLLVQKEVAGRLAADPGQMSVLAVTAQFYWEVSLGRVVEAALFDPAPKVDSQIVKLVCRADLLFDVDTKDFFRLVKAGFSQKRKTLNNNLAASYHIDKPLAASLLKKANIEPIARAQTLSLEQWHELYLAIANSLQSANA